MMRELCWLDAWLRNWSNVCSCAHQCFHEEISGTRTRSVLHLCLYLLEKHRFWFFTGSISNWLILGTKRSVAVPQYTHWELECCSFYVRPYLTYLDRRFGVSDVTGLLLSVSSVDWASRTAPASPAAAMPSRLEGYLTDLFGKFLDFCSEPAVSINFLPGCVDVVLILDVVSFGSWFYSDLCNSVVFSKHSYNSWLFAVWIYIRVHV